MTDSSQGDGRQTYADSYLAELEPLIEINWTGDTIESVLRLRALKEISEKAELDILMKLAFIAAHRPAVLSSLLEVGVVAPTKLGKDGRDGVDGAG